MRVFEHPNLENFKCPICGTSDDKPVTLIGINGTQEGFNIEANQYHIDCIELIEYREKYMPVMLAMTFKKK